MKIKNGIVHLSAGDFIYCPVCGVQKKGGKSFKVKCQIIGLEVLPPVGDNLTIPTGIDLEDGIVKLGIERERVGWAGPGLRIGFLCEDGHKWERVIASHKDQAFSFAEILSDDQEKEAELDRFVESDEEEED